MFTAILCAVILCIARLAAVYDERLWCAKYLTVSNPVSRLLIARTLLPFGAGKHAADREEDRRKLTVVGLALYLVSILCILCCVVNGLELEPVGALEQIGLARDRIGIRVVDSTESLNEKIVCVCLCFEMTVYLINNSRALVGEVITDGRKAIASVLIVLFVGLLLAACILAGKSTLDFWKKIVDAQR